MQIWQRVQNLLHKFRWHGLTLVILIVSTLFVQRLLADNQTPAAPRPNEVPYRSPDDGGEYQPQVVQELTPAQYAEIQERLANNVSILKASGKLPSTPSSDTVSFIWPLQQADGFSDFGYHGLGNFFDHDPNEPDQLLDYNCGSRTYDRSNGYNHQGTDYFLWPFGWKKMDSSAVEIVAAASGVIIEKDDGNFDRRCDFNSSNWNAVYIQHDDGSVAWYGHMKEDSVTTKSVGDSVIAGEYLGVVGSSGNSTYPHLHLEIYDLNNDLIDPYAGSCNDTTTISWWQAQLPYYDSAINKLTTGTSSPVFPTCPDPEIRNEEQYFQPGETINFSAYYRDQLAGQHSAYTIYRPDGFVYDTWRHTPPKGYYAGAWWEWTKTFGVGDPTGTWRWAVRYNGKTYRHPFFLGDPSPAAAPFVYIRDDNNLLNFKWTASLANCSFEFHRSTTPFFSPDSSTLITTLSDGVNSYTDSSAIGNTAVNNTYVIRAKNCNNSSTANSNRTGEFDFDLTSGTLSDYPKKSHQIISTS